MLRRSPGWLTVATLAWLPLGLVVGPVGCAGSRRGELRPPRDVRPWDPGPDRVFDDGVTLQPVRLSGRAPSDVLDQQAFSQRLGLANIVVLGKVDQVWLKATGDDQVDRFVELTLGEVLLGELPRGVAEHQTLQVEGGLSLDALPGADVIVFLRWSTADLPPFHHHLMATHPETVSFIEGMVRHAQDVGVLAPDKTPSRKFRRGWMPRAADSAARGRGAGSTRRANEES